MLFQPLTHSNLVAYCFSCRSKYQLRIYCTSSAYYTAPTAFRPQPTNTPCPMEFPNTCEIRVNNNNLHAQTKGLKKKAGTAPPANLGPHVRTTSGAINKVEMIYCNNNPVQGQPPNNRVSSVVNVFYGSDCLCVVVLIEVLPPSQSSQGYEYGRACRAFTKGEVSIKRGCGEA